MESLVEGVFGRAFRKQVHPVEIAKGLAKQMDENSMISVSRTYAPNDFTIHLMTPPKVRFITEESLRFGEFGVTAKLTAGEGPREKGAPDDTSGQTRIFRTESTGGQGAPQDTAAISAEEAKRYGLAREVVELVLDDEPHPLEGRGPWSIGRSEENDIVIQDPNVSRRHAQLSRSENGFIIEDLGSTNGTLLDGAPIDRERIENGDELTFGGITTRFVRRMSGPASPPDARKRGHGGR